MRKGWGFNVLYECGFRYISAFRFATRVKSGAFSCEQANVSEYYIKII